MPGIDDFIDVKPILSNLCDKCDMLFSTKADLIRHKVLHNINHSPPNTTKLYLITTVPSSSNNFQILLPKSDVSNNLIKIENLKTESTTDNEQGHELLRILGDEQEILVEEELNEEEEDEEEGKEENEEVEVEEGEGPILEQLNYEEFTYDEINEESNEETMNEDDLFEDVYDDNINIEIANEEVVSDENIIIEQIDDDIDFNDEINENSNNIESDEILTLEFDENLQADNDTTSTIEQSNDTNKNTDKSKYKCDTCDFECDKKTTLYSHVSRKHRHNNDNIYSCTICDFKSIKKASLASHFKKHTKDGEVQVYACSVCDYRTNKKSTLYSHIRHKHDPKQSLKLQQLFGCPESNCNYSNRSKHELKVHIARKHNDEYNFPCDQCDKKYKVKGDLTNHVRFDHIEKPVICEVCGKTCRNSHSLFVHQKFAHFKASFECNICKRRMVTQENLDEHMFRQHEHRENAECPSCFKVFNKASVLKIHMRIHSGERPYACKICEKKFVRRTALRQHALTHTDHKPYVCDVLVNGVACGKSFTQKPGLTCHRKTHPGVHPPSKAVFIAKYLTNVLDN